jgi:hypothetical protein
MRTYLPWRRRPRPATRPTVRRAPTVRLRCLDLECRITPTTLYGFSNNHLLTFNDTSPQNTISVAVTGLAAGETILDADVNPATEQLVALGSSARLYTINTTTGAATPIGSAGAFTLAGAHFGMDFNPVSGDAEIVSDAGQNITVNPITGALISAGPALSYAVGDVNSGTNPDVEAIAFTNSISGATSTTLYGIDANLHTLVTVDPGTGTLTTVGSLGIALVDPASFDIAPGAATGLAALSVSGGSSGLYAVDLTSGRVTLIGNIDGNATVIAGLAVAPPAAGGNSITSTINGNSVTITGTAGNDNIVIDTSGGFLRNNLFDQGVAGFASPFDFDSTTPGEQRVAVSSTLNVTVNGLGGDDTIAVGSASAPATTLGFHVTVNGGEGANTVTFDGSADTTGQTVDVTSTSVSVPATGTVISYSGATTLNVLTGTGDDTVNVTTTAPGTTTVIDNSAGGANTVHVGDMTHSLLGLIGPLTLVGGSGTDQLFVDNSGSELSSATTAYHVSGTGVRVSGASNLSNISLSGFESIDVTGGPSKDQFIVTPSATVAVSVHGTMPDGGHNGDSLIINQRGVTGATVTSTSSPTGMTGAWTFTNRLPVTFDGIEQLLPEPRIVLGAGPGGGPEVRVIDSQTMTDLFDFFAFDAGFRGGVSVAVGDINGDGVADIVVGAGAGGGPHVKVFDGAALEEGGSAAVAAIANPIASFFAFDGSFHGGVSVAVGDVNGDGKADIIVGAGAGGGPHVKVFDGAALALGGAAATAAIINPMASFFAYDGSFHGGVNVAAGDVNGDGMADVITGAGAGGGPHVKVFDGASLALGGSAADNAINNPLKSFFAYAANFQGGVSVAAGDINNDGDADIVTGAGAGGGPHVRVFGGNSGAVLDEFFAFPASFSGGVRVGVSDVNGDGVPDLVVGQGALTGNPSRLQVFSGQDLAPIGSQQFAFGLFTGGTFVGGV